MKTTLIDLHAHTRLSGDNDCDPAALFARAKTLGLDAVCITEHHSVEVSKSLIPLAEAAGILLLRACEASTDLGHLLLYGIADDSWNIYKGIDLPARDVVTRARNQGAVVVAAHPFRRAYNRHCLGARLLDLGLDGVESMNGHATDEENAEAEALAKTHGLAMTGGSDAHAPSDMGRALTLIEGEVRTIEDLVSAIRAHHTRGVRGRLVLGDPEPPALP